MDDSVISDYDSDYEEELRELEQLREAKAREQMGYFINLKEVAEANRKMVVKFDKEMAVPKTNRASVRDQLRSQVIEWSGGQIADRILPEEVCKQDQNLLHIRCHLSCLLLKLKIFFCLPVALATDL